MGPENSRKNIEKSKKIKYFVLSSLNDFPGGWGDIFGSPSFGFRSYLLMPNHCARKPQKNTTNERTKNLSLI